MLCARIQSNTTIKCCRIDYEILTKDMQISTELMVTTQDLAFNLYSIQSVFILWD